MARITLRRVARLTAVPALTIALALSATPAVAATPPAPTAPASATPSPRLATPTPTPTVKNFASVGTPKISGTAMVGRTLTATAGVWSPTPTITYRWLLDGVAVSGATAATWAVPVSALGKRVTVEVTAKRSGYRTTTVTSAATGAIAPATLTVPSSISISGTRTVGNTLTVIPGTWGPAPVSFAYQWMRDGKTIVGATSKSYTLTSADGAKAISVRIAGKKTGYTTERRTSAAVRISFAFTTAPRPSVAGTMSVGSTATASVGTWKPTPTRFAYQWRIDGVAVSGATASTWKIPTSAAGRNITVSVTAVRADYVNATQTSSARAVSRLLGTAVTPGGTLPVGTFLRSANGAYQFGLLGDGNVALSMGYQLLRTTRTTGTLDPTFSFGTNGDLVLRDGAGRVVWSSGTAGKGGVALQLRNDGLLELRNAAGGVVWSSAELGTVDATAASPGVPGRFGWAYPIRPSGTFTTYAGHSGDDIAVKTGTPIYSMRGGKVTSVREIWITSGCPSWAPNNTRQKDVVVTSVIDGATFVQTYSHLSAFSVKSGQTVEAGQKLGEVGSTGCSTGPHLHTDIRVDGVRYALYPRDVLGVASY